MKKLNFLPIEGRHRGQPILVLGCGPGMAEFDFGRAHEFITIGVNGILRAFDPDYYLWVDPPAYDRFKDLIHKSVAEKFAPAEGRVADDLPVNIFPRYIPGPGDCIISPNWKGGLFHSHTVAMAALNLAYLMGANPIIMAGVELNDCGHFYKPAQDTREYPSKPEILRHFALLAEFAARNNISILNATRGSSVRDFPFINLADFTAEKNNIVCAERTMDGRIVNVCPCFDREKEICQSIKPIVYDISLNRWECREKCIMCARDDKTREMK